MRAPAFWTQSIGLPAAALWPLSMVYAVAVESRFRVARQRRARVPVVCIGNVVAGGQGKTPCAVAVSRLFAAMGRRAAFLTRGHGGRHPGPVVVDAARHRAADVGDEPLLLARIAPTIVARNRPIGASLAETLPVDVIVMDDGFQNPGLAKDAALLVVDAAYGIGNGLLLPAGPLRAPLRKQLERADAVVLVGQGGPGASLSEVARSMNVPVFDARLEPRIEPEAVSGRRWLAYAGIGRPEKFFETIRGLGGEIAEAASFPDHHAFDEKDAAMLLERARGLGAALLTTEKDHVRLQGLRGARGELAAASTILPVDLVLAEPGRVAEFLAQRLNWSGQADHANGR